MKVGHRRGSCGAGKVVAVSNRDIRWDYTVVDFRTGWSSNTSWGLKQAWGRREGGGGLRPSEIYSADVQCAGQWEQSVLRGKMPLQARGSRASMVSTRLRRWGAMALCTPVSPGPSGCLMTAESGSKRDGALQKAFGDLKWSAYESTPWACGLATQAVHHLGCTF